MTTALLVLLLFLLLSSSPSSSFDSDSAALLSFKSSLSVPTAAAAAVLSSWDPSVRPCSSPPSSYSSWLGVSCSGGRVVRLVLEDLGLDGPINDLTLLPFLSLLSLKNNTFSSPELARLDLEPWSAHLKILHLSYNRFSGTFPAGVLVLRRLRRLDLAGNLIYGSIPPEIGYSLRHLLTLRLEENHLSSGIPVSLGCIQVLADLNVSNNRLAGEIPRNLSSFPATSFAGNPQLCGYPLPRKCPNWSTNGAPEAPRSKKRVARNWAIAAVAITVTAATAIAASVSVAALYCLKRSANGGGGGGRARKEKGEKIIYFEGCHKFELEELMRGSAQMLGRGAAGTTYRVVMEDLAGSEAVVVKRVRRREENCGAGPWGSKETEEEERLVREMGGWRHPNVVSLRAYYNNNREELLIVYDYLPNGSLSDLLHGNRGPGRIPLEWRTRLKLAMDAARGLEYLHSASKPMLFSHHHLSSSDVLVDSHGNARISDFGLAELVLSPLPSSGRLIYDITTGETSQRNDVYRFGVILLELLTGRPAKEEEGGCMELAAWVRRVMREEWTSEVFDIELGRGGDAAAEDEMFALLQVALLCTSPEAKDRPRMAVVYKVMEDIRDRGNRSRGSLTSPSSLHDRSLEFSSPGLSEDAATSITSS